VTKEQLDLLFYELNRIGNALEVLAVEASPDYYPMSEAVRRYQAERLERAQARETNPAPRG
jgi:hypothetical protein